MTDFERNFWSLAAEGKATRLVLGEIEAAKSLETDGLVFLVADTAVVTPKGGACSRKRKPSPSVASLRPVFSNRV